MVLLVDMQSVTVIGWITCRPMAARPALRANGA